MNELAIYNAGLAEHMGSSYIGSVVPPDRDANDDCGGKGMGRSKRPSRVVLAIGVRRLAPAVLCGFLAMVFVSAFGWRAYRTEVIDNGAGAIALAVYQQRATLASGSLGDPSKLRHWGWQWVRYALFDTASCVRDDNWAAWVTSPPTADEQAAKVAEAEACQLLPPDQSGLSAKGVLARSDASHVESVLVGWPCRAWRAVAYATPTSNRIVSVVRAVEGFDLGTSEIEWLRDSAIANTFPGRVVPTQPLWFGLVANVAVFAATAWGLLMLPLAIAAVRARRALRMGLCTHCRYPLEAKATICPECGTLRARRVIDHLRAAYARPSHRTSSCSAQIHKPPSQ